VFMIEQRIVATDRYSCCVAKRSGPTISLSTLNLPCFFFFFFFQ
jgi:hypothetical protein